MFTVLSFLALLSNNNPGTCLNYVGTEGPFRRMMVSLFSFAQVHRAYLDCRKGKRNSRSALEFGYLGTLHTFTHRTFRLVKPASQYSVAV
ncbi:MAG: hypothetical protein ABSD20_09610 [Terriglobales bacterium]|jgi:hypothetical protein